MGSAGLLPDWRVGIVHVASERQLDKVVALVSRTAVDRAGVSARFSDLDRQPPSDPTDPNLHRCGGRGVTARGGGEPELLNASVREDVSTSTASDHARRLAPLNERNVIIATASTH
jgi:hypothetical protein